MSWIKHTWYTGKEEWGFIIRRGWSHQWSLQVNFSFNWSLKGYSNQKKKYDLFRYVFRCILITFAQMYELMGGKKQHAQILNVKTFATRFFLS